MELEVEIKEKRILNCIIIFKVYLSWNDDAISQQRFTK